ncbi:fluoride efflux transporter CrcB [Paractinoplanes rishiriensis]|uniref:Fluoride-specific ion channel FluC n=1 Tax=Paractinoplanes rishiriensis TaxID=1050105 RepID=A0A919K881_9ACTN|nr:fluoride efflux transporter CrcB [Actinoplanes rishiriensis]GIE98381.1 putative fluoride ion transporter CrcB 2 [Actinoplanes rishiriensis]
MTVLLVAVGAAIGAPLRYLTDRAVQARFGARFPWGTLTVNVAGSFLLGFLIGLPAAPGWTALLGTGFCGALTTYSTFSWETLALARIRGALPALSNILLSVTAGLGAAYLGLLLARL